MSAATLQALVADNPTFDGLDADQFESLRQVVREVRQIEAGSDLLHEGDLADSIFIIDTGRFEVLKKEEDSLRVHGIAVLGPGMSVGEIALLDAGARAATVRALEPARVLVIPIAALQRRADLPLPIGLEMKLALGQELARRLRTSNQVTVRSLREALREAEIRASMGRTMARLLIGTSLYMFALSFVAEIKPYLPSTVPISVVILLAFATSVLVNIRTSGFPASAYGFNTRNWRAAVKDAILLSLPVAALMVLAKAILIHTVPAMAGLALFDLSGSAELSGWFGVLATALYALFVPVQEVIARGVQSAMMLYLRGRFRVLLAILIAALLFSATHLHTSLGLAVGAFPLGLFWGWLYWRNPTLIGVTLSHLLLGLFVFRVVGFPF